MARVRGASTARLGSSGAGRTPPGETYRDRGLMWMTKLLTAAACVLSEACVADLLASRLVEEPADAVTARGWCLFESFFLQAGLDAGRLVPREEVRHLAAEDDEMEIITRVRGRSHADFCVRGSSARSRIPPRDPLDDSRRTRARGDRSGL